MGAHGCERGEEVAEQILDLLTLTYEDAKRIFEADLTKDNHSKAHAVQMGKFMLEGFKLIVELEKVHKEAAENVWTEEDEREALFRSRVPAIIRI